MALWELRSKNNPSSRAHVLCCVCKRQNPPMQVEHFVLNEMCAILVPPLEHFHLFLFLFSWWSRWEITQRGKPSSLSLSPTLAHQHVSFNHLHIFIIQLPQVMNYSTPRFPHGNSERKRKECLLPIFTLPLFLPLPPFSLIPSSGSVFLSHCHSGTVRTKIGTNHRLLISVHVLQPHWPMTASNSLQWNSSSQAANIGNCENNIDVDAVCWNFAEMWKTHAWPSLSGSAVIQPSCSIFSSLLDTENCKLKFIGAARALISYTLWCYYVHWEQPIPVSYKVTL